MKNWWNSCAPSQFLCLLSAGVICLVGPVALAAEEQSGEIQGDRVNVRARPEQNAEVVTQVHKGDKVQILERKTKTSGGKPIEWMKIRLPERARCFVSSRYVADGVVKATSLYVRSGPGSNFRDVGKIPKGSKIEVVEKQGDWLQIKPTEHCAGWMAARYVKVLPAPPPAPVVEAKPPVTTPPPAPPPVAVAPKPKPPPPPPPPPPPAPPEVVVEHRPPSVPVVEVTEQRLETHVRYVVKDGVLRSVTDSGEAPGSYELLTPEVERRQHRICYLAAGEINLSRFEGKRVRVMGTERWGQGDRFPVVEVDRVDLIW